MRNRLLAVLFLLSVGLLLPGCQGTDTPLQQATGSVPSEDGSRLWLRYAPPGSICDEYRDAIQQIVVPGDSETSRVIGRELCTAVNAMVGSSLSTGDTWSRKPALIVGTPSNSALIRKLGWEADLSEAGPEGFVIKSTQINKQPVIAIASESEIGALYGTFHFLRLLQTGQSVRGLSVVERPGVQLRLLNHWDNLDGSVERGYAGHSLWQWDELPDKIDTRYIDYARINASVGINGAVINNVNANPRILTEEYLKKVAVLANLWRPYGVRVYLSANFAAPMRLGGLSTADPLNPGVADWWRKKSARIYELIPDFGGFLVKANSEGQPGPKDYGRTHAEGANVLADALAPHGGVVIWRAFVYDEEVDPDRVKRAYIEFTKLDGRFRPNVVVQVKNGPIDFQPREPFHPLFGGMKQTPVFAELQATQEYLGQAKHLVYHGTMWKEFLDSDTYAKGTGSTVGRVLAGEVHPYHITGIVSVTNPGMDTNWCGHHFSQANWYAFGRLAWNHELSAEQIAGEWVRMTFTNDAGTVNTILGMMLSSWETYIDYTMPLGLHHLIGGDHYAPMPENSQAPRSDWTAVYYHRAAENGIGVDRTSSGNKAVEQYFPPVRDLFNDPATCPEKFLLWFHRCAWDYKMKSGQTLWMELCKKYYAGAKKAAALQSTWQSLEDKIDPGRHREVADRLSIQVKDAAKWRDHILQYFQGYSKMPIKASLDASGTENWTTRDDHQNMMMQLGIRELRPGPSGNENDPNHANYDESLANPFPNLPEVLMLNNGEEVTSPEMWWQQRRPEIVEDFGREVLGRVPPDVPDVAWEVTQTSEATVGDFPVIGKQLVGHVDNSAFPALNVDIEMILVTPANATGPVPVMMMLGFGILPGAPVPPEYERFIFDPPPGSDPPATEQLLADGWGYAVLNPYTVQADNGEGLTRGIIGLVNKGQPRQPDDWGALRAWAWGASRGLDYLETDKAVDAAKVGIEGVSRFGKAALITMAFDTRFAVVLVGSSGEGGAKLHRRNFGEAVENLTGPEEYHWMAGNFLKYGASEADFGSMTPGDIPVDAHELIALCAPRPTFISYGIPEKGDAKWLDQQGSYMAAVAAGPVFRLLGAGDLGTSDDYNTEKMPPVNVGLLEGELAWRQHDGGHTDRPNWKYFIPWADRFLKHRPAGQISIVRPVPRTDPNSLTAHAQLKEKAKQGVIDVYFEGDSITRRWGATDYPKLLANWNENFFGWNAANFGWGADSVQNILWRLDDGELDGVHPKVIVLLAGTNDIIDYGGSADFDISTRIQDVTMGIKTVLEVMRKKAPEATIILMGIFPRNDNTIVLPAIKKINQNLSKLTDGKTIRYLNINDRLANADGILYEGMMDPDGLHPAIKGYQVWADALKPVFYEIIGPPAKKNRAPPPTGNPAIGAP